MPAEIERVFLDWRASALDRAAGWILERHGEDLRRVVVALPGSRAARALREKLARRAGRSWTPPRILTQGELIDEMVVLDRPVAGRLARTLAWARALSELPRERLELLAARPPEPGDLRASLALAETVRALHADLAQEGISFDRLARGPDAPSSAGEARRFEVLAQAQQRWRAILGELGLADPHESRFAAIDAGRVDQDRQVVLVGVADMNHLLRRLVHGLGARATALVVAPEEEAESFDDLGCVRTGAWKDRDLDIPEGRWLVAQGPEDQADRALERLGGFAPEEISIGLLDEEVGPHLERRLSQAGIVARHAAGTPVELTRPHRLLADLAAWLPQRSFAPYAALMRHPDLEATVRARDGNTDVPAAIDAYHGAHLPGAIDGHWLGREGESLRAVHDALLELLGSLASPDPRPLAEWPAAVRAFLAATYSSDLDRRISDQRVLTESLSVLSDALGEIERLPGALGRRPAMAAEALDLVTAISRGGSIPPPPAAPGESEIELLGWLELPLDDARALVVTGFQEGFVPRARRDDPFLPDGLRRRLGLPCGDDGVARDVYAATVLLRSKEEIAFVSGRRNRDGDPRRPSRLVFHVPSERIRLRVAEFLGESGAARPASRVDPAERANGRTRHELPMLQSDPPIESMPVTAFQCYLASPYHFYLKYVLGLETVDDTAREMDGLSFGILAHDVLEAFGRSPLSTSADEGKIAAWLRARVEEIGRARFGARPLPAVELQIAQLARRFALFARAQARRAAEGWRIHAVEWRPTKPVPLAMGDGEESMPLRGKIDRIDVHESSGAWAILDYKTGLSLEDPDRVHRSRGEWRDLQLPLYTLLARELGFSSAPSLGYFTLGQDESETRIRMAPWDALAIDSGLEAAREVVRKIREGKFSDLGRRFPDEPILLALAGKGLLEDGETKDEESEGEEGGE
ncbi:MAG: PD-(D/E)XK nuclease family protein [Planctomycetota bacterium]